MAAFFFVSDIYMKKVVRRKLLFEMGVYDETDVYGMSPIASVPTGI